MSERNRKVRALMHLAFELVEDDEVPDSDIIEMLVFCLACIAYNNKVTPLSILRLYDFWWKQVLEFEGYETTKTPEA
jgi:hypothetical protein